LFIVAGVVQYGVLSLVSAGADKIEIPNAGGLVLYLAFVVVIPALVGSFIVGIGAVAVSDRIATGAASIRRSFRAVPVVPAAMSGLLSALLLIVMLFLTGPVLATLMLLPALLGPPVVIQVVALEGLSFSAARTRALELTKGNWGRIPLYLLSISTGIGLLQYIVLGTVVASLDGTALLWTAAATQWVMSSALLPFAAIASLVIYLDLRARKDGLDHETFSAERRASSAGVATPG
jgi:small-conductance mechanosensitive channel